MNKPTSSFKGRSTDTILQLDCSLNLAFSVPTSSDLIFSLKLFGVPCSVEVEKIFQVKITLKSAHAHKAKSITFQPWKILIMSSLFSSIPVSLVLLNTQFQESQFPCSATKEPFFYLVSLDELHHTSPRVEYAAEFPIFPSALNKSAIPGHKSARTILLAISPLTHVFREDRVVRC